MADDNPYAAPRAHVEDARSLVDDGDFIPGGRAVPAGNGWSWITGGWDLFRRQPGMFILLVVGVALLFIVSSFIPLLGALAQMLLTPVLFGGLLIGCRAVDQGDPLEIAHAFAGFRQNTGTLVGLGVANIVLTVLAFIPVIAILGTGFFALFGGNPDGAALAKMGASFVVALLVAMALFVPVAMAMWFAPSLVVFHDLGVVEALKASFFACLKNFVPFLIFGLVMMVAAVIAVIPFGLGLLVLGPVILGSIYVAYRDIFFSR